MESVEHFLEINKKFQQNIQHVCVWRGKQYHLELEYFHHFILCSCETIEPDNKYKLELIQLSNIPLLSKDFLIAKAFAFQANYFCNINKCIMFINKKLGKYEIQNDPDKLWDFDEGVYFLGEFSYEERLNALGRAEGELGQLKYYSAETSNCETFVNWCFRNSPFTYQGQNDKKKAFLATSLIGLHLDAFQIIPIISQIIVLILHKVTISSLTGVFGNVITGNWY